MPATLLPIVAHYPPGSAWSRWYSGADAASIAASTESAMRTMARRVMHKLSGDVAVWSGIQAMKRGRSWIFRFDQRWNPNCRDAGARPA